MSNKCCCRGPCQNLVDSFDRANSTDLGASWDERSGDWEIFSNTLRENGTSGGLVIHTTEHIDTCMVVFVDVINAVENARYRVIVNYLDDNNYLFAELHVGAITCTLSVHKRIAGVETELDGSYDAGSCSGGTVPLKVCYSGCDDVEGVVAATAFLTSAGPWACAPNTGGKKAGLGNGSTETIQFDNFEFWEHFYTSRKIDCPSCVCLCEGLCIERDLIATFTATGGCEPHLDGETIALSYDDGIRSFGLTWTGSKQICEQDFTAGVLWDLTLLCSHFDTSGWLLCTNTTCASNGFEEDCSPIAFGAFPSSITCNPLSITYGPFTVTGGFGDCDCCTSAIDENPSGTFTIVITEAP